MQGWIQGNEIYPRIPNTCSQSWSSRISLPILNLIVFFLKFVFVWEYNYFKIVKNHFRGTVKCALISTNATISLMNAILSRLAKIFQVGILASAQTDILETVKSVSISTNARQDVTIAARIPNAQIPQVYKVGLTTWEWT